MVQLSVTRKRKAYRHCQRVCQSRARSLASDFSFHRGRRARAGVQYSIFKRSHLSWLLHSTILLRSISQNKHEHCSPSCPQTPLTQVRYHLHRHPKLYFQRYRDYYRFPLSPCQYQTFSDPCWSTYVQDGYMTKRTLRTDSLLSVC